jgi:pSer/pThr/pTyr-binding forkhead associated (FHA) protein
MEVKLVVVGGRQSGMEIPVPVPHFLIGRGQECHLRPNSSSVSRKHCAIVVAEGSASIEDMGSTNGTFVNGERIETRRELKNGDHLAIGKLQLDVQLAVSIGGKRKPKVHSIQEAAARTVAAAAAHDDDLDISGWLEEPDSENVVPSSVKPRSADDTVTGKDLMTDTTSLPANPAKPAENPKEPEKSPQKVPGKFQNARKPTAESSSSAASDMLRQFFTRKR